MTLSETIERVLALDEKLRGTRVKNESLIEEFRTAAPQLARALRIALKAIEAANRIVAGKYVPWANAGGPEECQHGYCAAIPCERCDRELLSRALAELNTLQP